jgi:prolipoprotein diacylglyceryltransferase
MYSHFDAYDFVTPFGLIFLGAIVVAWLLARRNAALTNIDGSHIDLLIPVTIIVGVAGGALLSLAMPMDRMIAGEMMQTGVRIRLFGLLATGAVEVLIYSYIVKLSFRRLLDVFALPTLAGLMIHRVGCYLAGCCWGDIVSNEYSTVFASQVQTLPFLSGLSNGASSNRARWARSLYIRCSSMRLPCCLSRCSRSGDFPGNVILKGCLPFLPSAHTR